jgi:Sulfotransferase domain
MVLPNFIIAGVQKSGTTSLHRYLQSHPDVFLPRGPQEIHYFDREENYRRGVDWYADLFRERREETAIGQTSPLYFYLESVPQRIRDLLPGVRLIVCLRNPVDRAYSHYWHNYKKARESLSFEEALRAEPERIVRGYRNNVNYSYTSRGLYHRQLLRYQRFFDASRMHFVVFERLKTDPAGEARRCCEFLGVDSAAPLDTRETHNRTFIPRNPALSVWMKKNVRNKSIAGRWLHRLHDQFNLQEGYPPMRQETRERLLDFFQADTAALASALSIDLAYWRDREGS